VVAAVATLFSAALLATTAVDAMSPGVTNSSFLVNKWKLLFSDAAKQIKHAKNLTECVCIHVLYRSICRTAALHYMPDHEGSITCDTVLQHTCICLPMLQPTT